VAGLGLRTVSGSFWRECRRFAPWCGQRWQAGRGGSAQRAPAMLRGLGHGLGVGGGRWAGRGLEAGPVCAARSCPARPARGLRVLPGQAPRRFARWRLRSTREPRLCPARRVYPGHCSSPQALSGTFFCFCVRVPLRPETLPRTAVGCCLGRDVSAN